MKSERLAAKAVESYVLEIRRGLHSRPELRWKEDGTLSLIKKEFEAIDAKRGDLSIKDFRGGIAVDLVMGQGLRTLLFRADIDAVPVQERTGLAYSSKTEGVSHACGHDAHTAILMGALKAIAGGSVLAKNNLRFVFQRAEENPGTEPIPDSGGKVLVEEGVCDGVSEAYALHISPIFPPGIFLSCSGQMLSSSDKLKISILSKGGHVAYPSLTDNPIEVGAQIIRFLKDFMQNNPLPAQPTILVPSIFHAGRSSNAIPATAEIWIALRTFLAEDERKELSQLLMQGIRNVAASFGQSEIFFERILGHPSLWNHPQSFSRVKAILEENGEEVKPFERTFYGEDFSHYLKQCPGAMWFLGCSREGGGNPHSPDFNPEESIFWKGVLFWILLATVASEP
jgi:hippurate hydrolase